METSTILGDLGAIYFLVEVRDRGATALPHLSWPTDGPLALIYVPDVGGPSLG